MNSINKLLKLASDFELKLRKKAQAEPQVAQSGTTELFFDSEEKQRAFATAIQDPNGPVYKVLAAIFAKTQAAVSFDLKASAEPGQSAKWILTVQPPAVTAQINAALNQVFGRVVGGNMAARQQAANVKAKTGSGSGTLDIGALDLS
jgi:hypothetical protein